MLWTEISWVPDIKHVKSCYFGMKADKIAYPILFLQLFDINDVQGLLMVLNLCLQHSNAGAALKALKPYSKLKVNNFQNVA